MITMHKKCYWTIFTMKKRGHINISFKQETGVKNLELKENIHDSLMNNFMWRYVEICMKLKIHLINKTKLIKNKKLARHMLLTCNFCAQMIKRAVSWVQGQFRPCGKTLYNKNEYKWAVVLSESENKTHLDRILLFTLRNLSGTRPEASTYCSTFIVCKLLYIFP